MNRKILTANNIKKILNVFLNKLINQAIIVLAVLLGIFIIKLININTTNKILDIIERNIYYDFSFKEDGKKIKDALVKIVNTSKVALEELADTMIDKK